MTATTAFLCRMTLSLVSITIATQSQIRTASGSDGVSAPSGSQDAGRLAMPRKTDPNATVPTPSAGKPKQIPAAPKTRFAAMKSSPASDRFILATRLAGSHGKRTHVSRGCR